MKKSLFLICFLLMTIAGFSQTMPRRVDLQPINAKGYEWLTGSFKNGLYFPQDTLQSADSGAVAIVNSVMYLKNIRQGSTMYWGPLSSGGSIDTTSMSIRIDNKANKIRLSEFGITSDADISYGSSTFGSDQTAAIQAILNTASASTPLYLIWDVRASVTGLQIKSHTTIECTKNSGAILRDNSDEFLLRSYRWETPFSSADSNVNITINGGVWNGNGYREGVARQIHSDSTHGLITGFNFGGCKNVKLQDVTVINTRTYALMFITIENLYIDNLTIDQSNGLHPAINQDGMDIIGYANNLVIKNCRLTCGDDRIAFGCNAAGGVYGGENHWAYNNVNGDQTHIKIENIRFESWGQGLRFNSSANKIQDVSVSNITGDVRGFWLIAENFDNLVGYDFLPGPGDMKNFSFKNIHVESDTFFSYQNPNQFRGAAMIGCNFDHISFENVTRNKFKLIQSGFTKPIASFAIVNGSIRVKNLIIDGYNSLDTSSNTITNHILVESATIENLRVSKSTVIRDSATNASVLVQVDPVGVVNNLTFNGVKTQSIDHMLVDSNLVNSLAAVNIFHANTSAATFVNRSAYDVPLVLSNYIGVTKTLGSFSPTSGDAYPTIGDLANTLLAGNNTSGTPVRVGAGTGTNRDVDIFSANIDNDFAALGIAPSTGTNVASELFFSPKGIGYGGGGIKTGISFFGTDYFNDPNNWDSLLIRVTDTANTINAGSFGTGTVKPLTIMINGVKKIHIPTTGGITFNNPYNATSFTFPSARASAGQTLIDAAGDGVVAWALPPNFSNTNLRFTGSRVHNAAGSGLTIDSLGSFNAIARGLAATFLRRTVRVSAASDISSDISDHAYFGSYYLKTDGVTDSIRMQLAFNGGNGGRLEYTNEAIGTISRVSVFKQSAKVAADSVYLSAIPAATADTVSAFGTLDATSKTRPVLAVPMLKFFKGSTTWAPGTVAAGSSTSTTLTVTGATANDIVHVNKVTSGYSNGEMYDAWVSAPNTVTIRVHNVSTGSANYSSTETYNVIVLKY